MESDRPALSGLTRWSLPPRRYNCPDCVPDDGSWHSQHLRAPSQTHNRDGDDICPILVCIRHGKPIVEVDPALAFRM